VLSALLPVISPGRTVLLLAPSSAQGKATEAGTRQLIGPMCAYCAGLDLCLAQTLVDAQDPALERAFVDEGFTRMAELYYLQAHPPAGAGAAAVDPPAGLSWVMYSPEAHDAFGRAILDSYQESLDCPALNGRRDIEDIVAGHKASGAFDPALWFLLRDDATGRSLGVLLLGHGPRGDAMELVYLGLSPAARGRRLGELMMRQALGAVARRGLARLCLAVDARNTPALKLYYRHGMQRIGSKLALLRDLRAADEAGDPDRG
jgi:ribosomal protein S18 acetylase RimI-like enzyme